VGEQTAWCFNENALHENIRKTLIKFCVPSPIVFSDVNYLSCTAPPAAAEWTSLLRPLRGREPEGKCSFFVLQFLVVFQEAFFPHVLNQETNTNWYQFSPWTIDAKMKLFLASYVEILVSNSNLFGVDFDSFFQKVLVYASSKSTTDPGDDLKVTV
jgi:hypothetical protein